MVMAGTVRSLFDGLSIASINRTFNKGSTGEVSNTGSEDTRVFRKNGTHWLTLVGQQVTVGKAFREHVLTNWFWGSVGMYYILVQFLDFLHGSNITMRGYNNFMVTVRGYNNFMVTVIYKVHG